LLSAGEKQCCRTNNLALLASVYCYFRTSEACRCAKPDLNKDQAIVIEHYQVDFAAAALKVAANRRQAAANQEVQRDSFCPRA
jgi:hypothetical protein